MPLPLPPPQLNAAQVPGGLWVGLFLSLGSALGVCYALGAADRVPFASANLRVACLGLQSSCATRHLTRRA